MAGRKVEISSKMKAEIFEEFMKFDKDRNGYISYEEAHCVLKDKLGFRPRDTKALLRICDTNHDGKLSYEEFIKFYITVKARIQEMREVFNEIDANKDGYISMDEAHEALRNMAFKDNEIESLVRAYDANGDGCLQYEEFIHFWSECCN